MKNKQGSAENHPFGPGNIKTRIMCKSYRLESVWLVVVLGDEEIVSRFAFISRDNRGPLL